MIVEKLAENFHSHASAYGLVKDRFGPRPLQPRAGYYTLTCVVGNQESQIFGNFFPACPGSGGRPDPERLTRPRVRARDSGDDRDRTGNLRLAKPALSQLSYVPGP